MPPVKRIVGIGCGGLLAAGLLFVLGGFLIPPEVDVGTEATLAAPPERVYSLVSTQAGVQEWWAEAGASAAAEGYPQMDVIALEGPGNRVRFESNGMTMETWTLQRATPQQVVWDVDFGMMVVERTLTLRPSDAGTHVTWHETGRIGNPVFRYLSLLMPEEDVVANFESALDALEAVAQR